MMPAIVLTEEQKLCTHNRALKVRASEETYTKFGETRHKAEICCADCNLRIAIAGTIYINRCKAIHGIISEHWPALIEKKRR